MTIFVIAKDGTKLMPTTNIRKVRKQLRSGRAEIFRHDPFTIRLLYESGKATQPIELTEDTGYGTVGLSIKSEKHEFVSEERAFLPDEKKKHDDCRKYRRARRNRKRYRKARFDNRTHSKPKGWLAPSLKNKADRHVDLVKKYMKVCPITSVHLECGQFDTQVLAAVEAGKPVPDGLDYQHGPRYGHDTLREAVFARDNYTCLCCEKSAIRDGVILRLHHIGYLKGDHSDRMGNLATVCTKCHAPKEHKPGGKLYGFKPDVKSLAPAAFMNTVKWYIFNSVKEFAGDNAEVHITYGAVTKRNRLNAHIVKTHANDAYCIGNFRPKHRCHTSHYEKVRRHNRVLTKFYDSVWIDRRDGSKKKGAELPNGRTNRNHKKDTENLHPYRMRRLKKGYCSIRKNPPKFRKGDTVLYKGGEYTVLGMKNNGDAVKLRNAGGVKNPSVNSVNIMRHGGGWMRA